MIALAFPLNVPYFFNVVPTTLALPLIVHCNAIAFLNGERFPTLLFTCAVQRHDDRPALGRHPRLERLHRLHGPGATPVQQARFSLLLKVCRTGLHKVEQGESKWKAKETVASATAPDST